MAKDFYDTSAVARDTFAEASDTLSEDVAALCFTDDPRLDWTENTQPAILTAEIAMFRCLQQEYGLTADRLGGHSLGEYAALVAAGVVPLAAAVRLVRARGQRMQAAVPVGQGAMTAITALGEALDLAQLTGCLAGLAVDVANHNSPEQVVLSGDAGDMLTAEARLRAALPAAQLTRLAVSAPFHARQMAPITEGFRALLREAAGDTWSPDMAGRVVSNHTGTFYAPSTEAVVEGLAQQIARPVRWVDNMHALCASSDEGVTVYEVGPKRPLRGFFRAIGVEVTAITNRTTARRALARR